MGYACPVCDAPQRDAEHLANHLALTAMVHGEDHEAWLDEHAPGWSNSGPADLGERVAPLAEPAEYDEVFEDTVHGHVGESDHDHPVAGRPDAPPSPASPDDEATREALAEARELTRRMLDGEESDDVDDVDDDHDGNASGGADGDGSRSAATDDSGSASDATDDDGTAADATDDGTAPDTTDDGIAPDATDDGTAPDTTDDGDGKA